MLHALLVQAGFRSGRGDETGTVGREYSNKWKIIFKSKLNEAI